MAAKDGRFAGTAEKTSANAAAKEKITINPVH
jgi:hypothetical protein